MDFNGRKLRITPASFDEAMELQEAIAEALKGSKVNLSGLSGAESSASIFETELSELNGPLETVINMILSVITSKRVKDALFTCCGRVVLGQGNDSEKIDRAFFDKVENRELYYPIMTEVIKENVGPFFKRLGSMFQGTGGVINFLKSKLG